MIKNILKDNLRLDGRDCLEYRNIKIRFSNLKDEIKVGGKCIIYFGETCVSVSTQCDVVKPKPSHPSRGLLNLNINTSFIKDRTKKLRHGVESALLLESDIKKFIRESVNMESLCICADEKVFSLTLNLNILSDDGNVLDCLVFASVLALKTFKRPDLTSDGNGRFIIQPNNRVALTLYAMPLCVTLNYCPEYQKIILDCTKDEELSFDGRVVFIMTSSGERKLMWPLGGAYWPQNSCEHLNECERIIKQKIQILINLVEDAKEAYFEGGPSIIIESTRYLSNHPALNIDSNEELQPDENVDTPQAPELEDMEIDSDYEQEEQETFDEGDNEWAATDNLLES